MLISVCHRQRSTAPSSPLSQQRLERVLQAARLRLVVGAGQHGGGVLCPGFGRCRVVAARQQLQLQRPARGQLIGGRRDLGGHFQAQQGFARLAGVARSAADGLRPGAAHRRADGAAQLLHAGHLLGLALLPGAQQLRQRLAMGLRGQLAQLGLGVVHRVALRAEGGVAQARAAVFTRRAIAKAARVTPVTKTIATAGAATGTVTPAGAITRAAGATAGRGLCPFGTGPVVAAHGDQRLGGLGRGRGRRRGLAGFGVGCGGRVGCCVFRSCLRRIGGRWSRFLFRRHRHLAARGSLQLRHGGADALGVAAGVGRFERLGGVEHGAVVRAHGRLLLLALGALAIEGLVDGLAEGVPQLLLVAALQRHGLRLGLPALLQGAHGVHTQLRRGAELFGLLNQCLAARCTLLLGVFQRLRGGGWLLLVVDPLDRRAAPRTLTAKEVVLSAGVLGTTELLLSARDRWGTVPYLSPQLGRRVRTNSEAFTLVLQPDDAVDVTADGSTISSDFHPDASTHVTNNRFPASYAFMRLYCGPLVDGGTRGERLRRTVQAVLKDPASATANQRARGWNRRATVLTVMQHDDNELELHLGRAPLWGLRSRLAPGAAPVPTYLPQANAAARAVARASGGTAYGTLLDPLLGIGATAHVLGGAVIGATPDEGVVDPEHRVFATADGDVHEDLRILDGSVVPANIGVNPSLTITALAERAMALR